MTPSIKQNILEQLYHLQNLDEDWDGWELLVLFLRNSDKFYYFLLSYIFFFNFDLAKVQRLFEMTKYFSKKIKKTCNF